MGGDALHVGNVLVAHEHERRTTDLSQALVDRRVERALLVALDVSLELVGPNRHLRHGRAQAPVQIGDIEKGLIFIPFHYGSWDAPGRHAANELTLTEWDPVSKQPHFKYAAVSIHKVQPLLEKAGVTGPGR